MWRLLENKMHDRSHAIIRLAVHLPAQQPVYFIAGQEQSALDRASSTKTTLEAWFILNNSSASASELLYTEIPKQYVFSKGQWLQRKQGQNRIIARMYAVSPKDIERFYLRLLLLNVKGAISFEDLRTVDGKTYATFKEAAIHRHLLDDDEEWERCLAEAATCQSPSAIRLIFALICAFNSPKDPLTLWNKFKEDMTEDYRQKNMNDLSNLLALQDIEKTLLGHGLHCKDLGLPDPGPQPNEVEFQADKEAAEAILRVNSLNSTQKVVFREITAAVEDKEAKERCFFLDGPGGTGKTYLYNTLMSYLRGKKYIVLPFATTGIAADLLKGGRTVHSGFKLPIPITDTSTSSMKLHSPDASNLRKASLIIIDEAAMLLSHALRCIDLLLRELMDTNTPFGGKVLVLGGDFRQTLPVVPRGSKADIIGASIKSSPLWRQFKVVKLKTNMRSKGQHDFNEWLLTIGDGKLKNDYDLTDDNIEIPQMFLENNNIIDAIYGSRINENDLESLSMKIIVTPKNKDALALNDKVLDLLATQARSYKSADSILTDDPENHNTYQVEFLNAQTPSGMPPHKLNLKLGSLVMLIRNLNAKKGLCNGTRLIIKELCTNFIKAQILTGTHKGDTVFLPRIDIAPTDTDLPFTLKRRQFPIIPAFVITINKAQGQSFDKVGVFLKEPVFSHGQLYVALTRTRFKENLKIFIESNDQQVIISICWLAGLVVGFLPLMGWHQNRSSNIDCFFLSVMDYNYLVFLYFGTIITPALLLAAFYAHIYRVVLKQLRQIVVMNPVSGDKKTKSLSSGGMIRMLCAQQRHEVKSTQNLAIIVLFFMICWIPLYTVNCIIAFHKEFKVNSTVMYLCIILSHLNSAGNPLLYAYHLKDFRAALKNFFCDLFHIPQQKCNQFPPRYYSNYSQDRTRFRKASADTDFGKNNIIESKVTTIVRNSTILATAPTGKIDRSIWNIAEDSGRDSGSSQDSLKDIDFNYPDKLLIRRPATPYKIKIIKDVNQAFVDTSSLDDESDDVFVDDYQPCYKDVEETCLSQFDLNDTSLNHVNTLSRSSPQLSKSIFVVEQGSRKQIINNVDHKHSFLDIDNSPKHIERLSPYTVVSNIFKSKIKINRSLSDGGNQPDCIKNLNGSIEADSCSVPM